jgi:hypothetical protein
MISDSIYIILAPRLAVTHFEKLEMQRRSRRHETGEKCEGIRKIQEFTLRQKLPNVLCILEHANLIS